MLLPAQQCMLFRGMSSGQNLRRGWAHIRHSSHLETSESWWPSWILSWQPSTCCKVYGWAIGHAWRGLGGHFCFPGFMLLICGQGETLEHRFLFCCCECCKILAGARMYSHCAVHSGFVNPFRLDFCLSGTMPGNFFVG